MALDTAKETSPGFDDWELKRRLQLYDSKSFYPTELKDFYPPEEAIRWVIDGQKPVRLIFGDIPLTDAEEKALAALQDALIERQFSFDNCFMDRDYQLRFLQGNEWNISKCIEDMERHLVWRLETYPLPLNKIAESLKKGYCYVFGRDKLMRPIFIIRCHALQNCVDVNEAMGAVLYWLEFIIQKLLVRNRVCQWSVIINLADCSFSKFPATVMREVASCLMRNFRGRLCRMTVINTPMVFSGLWKVIQLVLPLSTRKKISFLSSSFQNELRSFIHPCQLEEYLGGKLKNCEDFTIPHLPKGPFK